MTARDRFLVTQRCLHHFDGPVEVEQLALSPWGASANLRGTWGVGEGAPSGNELEAWRHRATFGRDHYVRLVYAGRLFPTGHGASLVKVTERVFESPAEEVDEQVAVLRQRFFLVIKERAREYPVDETWQRDGRDLPFTRIELLTEVTPNLDMPSQSSVVDVIDGGYSAQAAFWPRVGGDDLMFEMVGTDHAGRSISFRAPLLFVSKERELCATPQRMAELANWYNEHSGSERSRVALHGQIIAVAPPGATAGSTDLEVVEVALGADSRREDHGTGRVFRPAARRIRGRVQALATVLGREDPIWFEYAEPYTARGFAGIKGEVFLEVAKGQPAPLLSFTDPTLGRKTGGVVSPSMRVKGISRKLGPVGAGEEGLSGSPIPAGIADGHFTPREFFEGAAMLGSLALEQLLKTGAVENAPRITTRPSGSRIISELRWSTRELKNAYVGVVDFVRGPDCRLRLQATTVVDLAAPGVEPETSVLSELHDFTLGLVREGGEHLLTLRFDKLAFYSRNGGKPDIDVVLRRVQLGGSLGFIRRLQRFIPADGFSDPPDLEVAADGITASYDVGLPSVELGVFSLQNLRLGAGLRLPFNGAPVSAWFYFCRRSDPFALTLGPFGGGGFFELELGADGLERVEAALEARGEFSLDIGIASGGVRVRVGIYWRWTQADLYFEAYFEISGHVSVLGLVSVSVTFFLALGWGDDTSGTYLEGTATMVVEVEILCFSTSVELTVRRRLAGSPADPPFDAVFPATSPGASEAWTNYCDAFAA
ncbi:MAG: hypothetical protein H6713_42980 [Myxococcales bacterium]|nr:hypothetical protein [Myxococcales bacterium]